MAGRLAASVVAAALLVAACGSATKSGGGPAAAAGTASGPASAAGSATSSGGSASGGSAAGTTVEVRSGPMGTFLTDASGKSLYMFASDTATTSSCAGSCATVWPPLTVTASPTASGGATSGRLTTITRADGATQVVYSGHPLYYFTGDRRAGDTTGQGVDGFGARWWLLTPSGRPITGSGAPKSSAPSSSPAGGGGGY
jgi:predicted lipoprotein with Yx(FWY)xxD motif